MTSEAEQLSSRHFFYFSLKRIGSQAVGLVHLDGRTAITELIVNDRGQKCLDEKVNFKIWIEATKGLFHF